MLEYVVEARRVDDHGSVTNCKDAQLAHDTELNGRADAFNRGASDPAEPPLRSDAQGGRLCRPSEIVLEILPNPHIGRFVKEDGEVVEDA